MPGNVRRAAVQAPAVRPSVRHTVTRLYCIETEQLLRTEAAHKTKHTYRPMQYCKNTKTTQYTKL